MTKILRGKAHQDLQSSDLGFRSHQDLQSSELGFRSSRHNFSVLYARNIDYQTLAAKEWVICIHSCDRPLVRFRNCIFLYNPIIGKFNFRRQSLTDSAKSTNDFAANFAGFQLTDVLIENCYAVFSGGALHTEAAITIAPCTGVQMINNAATSFGGAFTSFAGSNLVFTLSEFSDNVSGFYGGGLLALYGNATVTYSKINRNRWILIKAWKDE